MKVAFYGSSLTSSYWNGAATYYRGLLKALAAMGHQIVFFEPDAFGRQDRRDFDPSPFAKVVVWPATEDAAVAAAAAAAGADVVVKASGIGVFDELLLDRVMAAADPRAIRIFWDVDAPATLSEIRFDPAHPVRAALPKLDMVLTYGGGAPVVDAYSALGARFCAPIYNALDPQTHHPEPAQERFAADLGLLANRLPDREARVETFFLEPASRAPHLSFLLAGAGWEDRPMPANVRRLGHLGAPDHNAFNASCKAVLNVARDSMAATGYSPATRVFEAAGAGACLITDYWEGIDCFLRPGEEILVARDGAEVLGHLRALGCERAQRIGKAALRRVLAEHTYEIRAAEVHALLEAEAAQKRRRRAA